MTGFALLTLGLSSVKQDYATRDERESAKDKPVNSFHFLSPGKIGKTQAHEYNPGEQGQPADRLSK
jgi:hypothetical protein